ncbi:MAG TPA: hypothetical protein VHI98_19985, partial [Vicinamibacterales bacterium]|nr:hypothetical protein [Vicinamibacterales bacterium]
MLAAKIADGSSANWCAYSRVRSAPRLTVGAPLALFRRFTITSAAPSVVAMMMSGSPSRVKSA